MIRVVHPGSGSATLPEIQHHENYAIRHKIWSQDLNFAKLVVYRNVVTTLPSARAPGVSGRMQKCVATCWAAPGPCRRCCGEGGLLSTS
jgi:hypothetical protein